MVPTGSSAGAFSQASLLPDWKMALRYSRLRLRIWLHTEGTIGALLGTGNYCWVPWLVDAYLSPQVGWYLSKERDRSPVAASAHFETKQLIHVGSVPRIDMYGDSVGRTSLDPSSNYLPN